VEPWPLSDTLGQLGTADSEPEPIGDVINQRPGDGEQADGPASIVAPPDDASQDPNADDNDGKNPRPLGDLIGSTFGLDPSEYFCKPQKLQSFLMQQLQDLNFGITRWFLRPPFLVKIGSAIISFILLIYIFVVTSRFADSIWKDAIGRGHVIICALMALTMICQCLMLLFYFYKTFSQVSNHFFFASLAFGTLYLVIVFCACFVSTSKSNSYTATITSFLFNRTDAASAQTFIRQYSVDLHNEDGVANIVRQYVNKRTVSVKTGISIVSMLWLGIIALLYFVVLFEAKPDVTGNQHVHSMRSEIDA
jgi:hypothetical protein